MDTQLATRHNLPPQPTSFVGREAEIAEITALLADPACRLLTLVGAGGIGKTRLAIEVARCKLDAFPDGVIFVPLQPLTSHENIVFSIADALGIQFFDSTEPSQQLLNYLSKRHMLLLMDNFEHLMDGLDLLTDILATAPHVKILVTSRAALNLREERLYDLHGLTFPQDEHITRAQHYSAIQLFAERARNIYREFSLEDDLPDVVHICQLVGGIPLAIEIAASWLRTLSCEEIAAEIKHSQDILATPLRDMPDRHRSMQAVFDWSWSLLTDEERAVFRRLSVFRGGCTRQAAQAITRADLWVLQALVDKSIIRRDPESGRYEVHELLRQYGETQLEACGQFDAAHDAHMDYYAGALQQRAADLKGSRQLEALDDIESDFENIRAAWNRAVEQRTSDILDQMMESLTLFCDMRARYVEGDNLLRYALERIEPLDEDLQPTWNRLRARWIQVEILQEKRPIPEHIQERLKACLTLAQQHNDQDTVVLCWWLQSELNRLKYPPGRDSTEDIQFYEQVLNNRHLIADQYYLGRILRSMAWYFGRSGQERFKEINQQHLDVTRAIGDRTGMAHAIFYNGVIWPNRESDCSASQRAFNEAAAIWEAMGDRKSVGVVRNHLGYQLYLQGEFEQAEQRIGEALTLAEEANYFSEKPWMLSNLGILAVMKGDYHEGWRLAMAGHTLSPLTKALSLSEPWPVVVAAYALGEYQKARRLMRESLKSYAANLFDYAGYYWQPGGPLVVAAMLFAHEEESERATEVLSLAFAHAVHTGWLENWPLLNQLHADLKAELGAGAYQAAWERGKRLDLNTTLQDLLEAFRVDDDVEAAFPTHVIAANERLPEPLTERELQILHLIADGLSNQEIADHLVVSIHTVKTHAKNLYSKLGVANRTQAARHAQELGLV